MAWTLKKVKKLKSESLKAQNKIAELFLNHSIAAGNNQFAWGQFFNLDINNPQTGIYGTSAGIQVLTLNGTDLASRYIQGACQFICGTLDENLNTRFRQKGDFEDIYKLAYIVEACPASNNKLESSSPQMEELARRQIRNTGWGEFYSDEQVDAMPKVLSTSMALLALSRYSSYVTSSSARDAVTWLARQVQTSHNLGIAEIAVATLALYEYRSFDDNIHNFGEALDYCKVTLSNWAKQQKSQVGLKDYYPYSISQDGTHGNRYIFLLPDCLVALALLRIKKFSKDRKYILNVINFFVTEVLYKNGFAPDERRQVSTVDHLWIYRLFREFDKVGVKNIIPPAFYVLASYPTPLKVSIAVLLLILAIITAYFDFRESGWELLSAIWIILGGLFASLTAEIIAHIGLDRE